MKLYFAPGACSLSPHIVLIEAGLPFDKVKADTKTKAMDGGGDYKTVNPLGYVPALQLDDGTILTEGPAIVQFIADKVPDKKLAPANGTLERTRLQSWLNLVSTELHKSFSPLFNPSMPEDAKKIFRERLATRLPTSTNTLPATITSWARAFPSPMPICSWSPTGRHGSTSISRPTPTCWPIASASAVAPPCRRR